MDRAAIIDLHVLQELRDTAGPDFAAELAQTFAEDVPGMLSALEASRAAGDAVAFRRAAHSLKANASTFGALPLAELARDLEHAELASVQAPALETLRQACDEAIAALRELCRG
jgi:HPt (histidine-containing phosphotransfer) domain-containing protein